MNDKEIEVIDYARDPDFDKEMPQADGVIKEAKA